MVGAKRGDLLVADTEAKKHAEGQIAEDDVGCFPAFEVGDERRVERKAAASEGIVAGDVDEIVGGQKGGRGRGACRTAGGGLGLSEKTHDFCVSSTYSIGGRMR